MNNTKRYVIDVDESMHRKLKILAGVRRVKIRKLTDEAVEMYLKEKYESSISEILKENK